MKKSKLSEEQVVRILQEAASGKPVREAKFYVWRRKYGGMETPDVKRLRELEAENAALKRIVADQALVIDATRKLFRKMAYRFRPPHGSADTDGPWPFSAAGQLAHGGLQAGAHHANRHRTRTLLFASV